MQVYDVLSIRGEQCVVISFTLTLFFFGGGVDWELVTISWVGVSALVESACRGLLVTASMSRGRSRSLHTDREFINSSLHI